jgi:hypothetical protein
MSILNASAQFGLSALGQFTRPTTSGSAIIGQGSQAVPLPASNVIFSASLYLQQDEDEATLDTTDLSVTIDSVAAVAATGVLTLTGNAIAAQTVTIGTVTYTFRATVPAAYDVLIGASASDTLDNLIAAINGAAGSGTVYGTGTVAHPTVSAVAGSGDTMDLTADTAGTAGNAIATTETMTLGSFGAATLTGGLEASAWTGAADDFEGNPQEEPSSIQGVLIACTAGEITVTQSTALTVTIPTGGKLQLACVAGLPNLYNTLTFTAGADNTTALITVVGTL